MLLYWGTAQSGMFSFYYYASILWNGGSHIRRPDSSDYNSLLAAFFKEDALHDFDLRVWSNTYRPNEHDDYIALWHEQMARVLMGEPA